MNDTMLLAVDEKDIYKKDFYSKELDIQNVRVVHNLVDAKEILSHSVNGEIPFSALIINFLLVDQEYREDQLKEIAGSFQGAIILKVKDELTGVALMKSGLITEYFVDDEKQLENLKQVFKVAIIRKRSNERLTEIHRKLELTKALEATIQK